MRCADCGYLGFRPHETNECESLTQSARNTWPGQFITRGEPACYVGAIADFKSKDVMNGYDKDKARAALARDWNCKRFCQLIPGKSPKEHADMEASIELAKIEREARAAEAAEQRAHDLAVKVMELSHAAEQERKNRTAMYFSALAAVLFTAALAYFGCTR